MKDVCEKIKNLEARTVPEALTFHGFGACMLRTGDVLWVPGGYVVCEKAINDADICLRRGGV